MSTTMQKAWNALDTALTGGSLCHHEQPVDLNDLLDRDAVYFSDGGYTRVSVRFHPRKGDEVELCLIETGVTGRREAWERAKSERQAVIEVIRTELYQLLDS